MLKKLDSNITTEQFIVKSHLEQKTAMEIYLKARNYY